jgi:hypothetical protein
MHTVADLGFFTVLARPAASRGRARAGHHHGGGQQAPGADGSAPACRWSDRTTRRMSLTPEGELYLEHARRILGEIDELSELLTSSKGRPEGLLRVNATLGFGRSHVAPVISSFVRAIRRWMCSCSCR